MKRFSFRKDVDLERQGPNKNDGTGSEEKNRIGQAVNQPLMMKNITSKTKKSISEMPARWIQYFHWDVAFLVVCVVAIAVDPLFFYLPVIDEDAKCISIDNTLKIIAICVRSFLDLVALGDLLARKRSKCPQMKRSDYVVNIISILPVHQVLMPIIFSEMRGSKIRHMGKFLNAVVVLQYLPRIFRIYRLWIIVNETIILPKSLPNTSTGVNVKNPESYKNHAIPPKGFIVMKAGFNLFLYLLASHALGAFWYFFSIERETKCWQLACEHNIGCSKLSISLTCGSSRGFGNYMFLNDFCSIEKPNTTLFDFGIFEVARQSGILTSMDFPLKTIFCFWWGLRNLSSLGQNLQTSPYYWENCFTVLISIFGLILFLYFIGNLQVYMQREASNELEEIISKWSKFILETKLNRIKNWISTMELPHELEKKIMSHVTPKLEDQNYYIDTENPFPHLPKDLKRSIKLHLCLPLLRRLPMFENESENLLSEITIRYLKRVQYNQNRIIARQGRPLDTMIFVVKGHVCTYTSNNHGDKTECPEKCHLIGEYDDLVKWVLESSRQTNPPLSTRTLKCHTKVEAFRLMAGDLKDMIHNTGGNLPNSVGA